MWTDRQTDWLTDMTENITFLQTTYMSDVSGTHFASFEFGCTLEICLVRNNWLLTNSSVWVRTCSFLRAMLRSTASISAVPSDGTTGSVSADSVFSPVALFWPVVAVGSIVSSTSCAWKTLHFPGECEIYGNTNNNTMFCLYLPYYFQLVELIDIISRDHKISNSYICNN